MVVKFGGFEVDLLSGEVRKGGIAHGRLQDQPLKVLAMLTKQPGELVTRDSMRDRLWPENVHVDYEHGIAKAVLKLRTILGDSAESPRFIETVPRRGYRFLADVHRVAEEAPSRVRRSATHWVAATAAIGLVTLGAFLAMPLLREVTPPQDDSVAPRTSIAVLPFQSLESAQDRISLGLGMAETLISRLSNLGNFSVRPTSAVMGYVERTADTLEVGRLLGVDVVLDGTYQLEGSRVRVSMRLLQVADGHSLWAEVIDQDTADPFQLQDLVTERLFAKLSLGLPPEDGLGLAKRYTTSVEAYEQYLRGRYLFEKRTVDSLNAAVASFQRAVELDPEFALAYAGIAHAYGPLVTLGHVAPEQGNASLKAAAFRALELDDSLAEVQTAVALAHSADWDWIGEERGYQKAIALNPNYAMAYQWYGFLLRALGHHQESLEMRQKARELDPLNITHNISLATSLFRVGRVDEALTHVQKTLELDPDSPRVLENAGDIHAELAEFVKAQDFFERAGSRGRVSLACAKAQNGETMEARAILGELAEMGGASPYELGAVYASLGEINEAFGLLEEAYRQRTPEMMYLGFDWRLLPLHSDPRFGELLRRVGLRRPS